MTTRGIVAAVVDLLMALVLAGCANPDRVGVSRPDIDQPRHHQPAGEIWGQQTVGQTFVAEKNGLNRIAVLLATYARVNIGLVIFHLRESPAAGQDLATVRFDASGVRDNAYRTFTFPPLRDSRNRSYYFFLEAADARPGNAITVWASPWDVYSRGRAYLAGQPQAGDLAFRTYANYSLAQIGRDLWHGIRGHVGTGVLAVLLLLVPGYVVLALLYGRLGVRDRGLDTADSIILASGLSVAMASLLILFASLTDLRLSRGPIVAWLIVPGILTVLPALREPLRRRHSERSEESRSRRAETLRSAQGDNGLQRQSPNRCHSERSEESRSRGAETLRSAQGDSSSLAPLLLFIIFIVSLAAKLLVVQGLVAPMWGDSYHHTVIAQLLADHGGLFQSWEPYAPLRSFTYHFGFHANVALFHWLTDTPVLKSVLIVGQILNALAPLMIYPLVRQLGGTAWAGVIAVLIASLFSPMPARYVNWGRYTQLTGMVILPVAATLTIDAISSGGGTWRRLALASVAVAGLILSHYLVTVFYISLLLAYLVWQTGPHIRQKDRSLPVLAGPWLRAGVIGILAGILIAPWILNLWNSPLPRVLAGRFGGDAGAAYFQTEYNVVGDVFSYVPGWLVALAAAGAMWGCWQGRPRPARLAGVIVSTWTALLILVANPNIIRLPGAGVVNNFTVLIALYLPLSILAGAGLAQLVNRATARFPHAGLMAAGLIILASLAGARLRLMDLDYRYRLVAPADQEAMQWIRAHTPEDAKFLVNSFMAFGGHAVVGDDAGWWIPYLANRRNTVPPATYGLELPNDPDYRAQIEAFYSEIRAQPLDSPRAVQALRANDVTHVYIGAAGGELLDPATLIASPFYHLVYDREGVMVFELRDDYGRNFRWTQDAVEEVSLQGD